MNLVLSHLIEKKFNLISLKLLSSSVSSHFMKKNLILFHLMKIKSDSVSSHQKKILSCPDSDPGQNWTRMRNPGSCDQSSQADLVNKHSLSCLACRIFLCSHMLADVIQRAEHMLSHCLQN